MADFGAFAQLITNPDDLKRVAIHAERVLWQSFLVDRQRETGKPFAWPPSERAIDYRFQIYAKWFRIFYGDLKYVLQKTLDLLPWVLRREIDGLPIELPSDGVWPAPMEAEFLMPEERQAARIVKK